MSSMPESSRSESIPDRRIVIVVDNLKRQMYFCPVLLARV